MEKHPETRTTDKNTDNLLPPMSITAGLLMIAICWLLAASFALAGDVEYLIYDDGRVQVCQPAEGIPDRGSPSTMRIIIEERRPCPGGPPCGPKPPELPCCDGFGVPDKGTPVGADCRICGIPSKGSPE